MKRKVFDVTKLLADLDSTELKELRKQFNSECSSQMWRLEEKEREEVKRFIDGLSLDGGWYNHDVFDAVSLKHRGLSLEQHRKLRAISDQISSAFRDLEKLKLEVARECRLTGNPYSSVFTSTVRRMKKYRNR